MAMKEKALCVWDAIIPNKGLPTIYIPVFAIAPVAAINNGNAVGILFDNNLIQLHESKILAEKISQYEEIIIAEADEGLFRSTKIVHTIMK